MPSFNFISDLQHIKQKVVSAVQYKGEIIGNIKVGKYKSSILLLL